jgi:hypothetical protein
MNPTEAKPVKPDSGYSRHALAAALFHARRARSGPEATS